MTSHPILLNPATVESVYGHAIRVGDVVVDEILPHGLGLVTAAERKPNGYTIAFAALIPTPDGVVEHAFGWVTDLPLGRLLPDAVDLLPDGLFDPPDERLCIWCDEPIAEDRSGFHCREEYDAEMSDRAYHRRVNGD